MTPRWRLHAGQCTQILKMGQELYRNQFNHPTASRVLCGHHDSVEQTRKLKSRGLTLLWDRNQDLNPGHCSIEPVLINNLPRAKLQAVNLKETRWHRRCFIYLKLGNRFHMVKGWKGLLWKPARPSGKGRRVLLSPTSAVRRHTSGLWGGADPREHGLSRGVITWWCRRQAVPPLHLCSSFSSQTWKSYRLLLSREQSPCSWAAASHAKHPFLALTTAIQCQIPL